MNRTFTGKSLFWLLVVILLTILFGYSSGNYLYAFFFASLFLPVVVGTSYFFNQFLVPDYLQKGRYIRFGIYFIYLIVISLWLEMMVVFISYTFLANYKYAEMNPETSNVLQLGLALYLVVFADAFRLTFKKLHRQQQRLEQLEKIGREECITIRVNRENIKVAFDDLFIIESLGDYLKLYTAKEVHITRIKISKMSEQLPPHFLRIHRSFIVNTRMMHSHTKDHVTIRAMEIPISRTYKAAVLEVLNT